MSRFKNPKDYAFWLLSCREYTVKKLQDKCIEKFPEEAVEIEKLINFLVQKEYLSDQRFTESFIRVQVRQGQGRQKIFMKLLQKGVPKEVIEAQLDSSLEQEDVLTPVIKLMNKKSIQLKRKYPEIPDYELRQKLTAYLAGRGYGYAVTKEVLSDM